MGSSSPFFFHVFKPFFMFLSVEQKKIFSIDFFFKLFGLYEKYGFFSGKRKEINGRNMFLFYRHDLGKVLGKIRMDIFGKGQFQCQNLQYDIGFQVRKIMIGNVEVMGTIVNVFIT